MTRALALALLLAVPAPVAADGVPRDPGASAWPEKVLVYRMHHRGSRAPARVDVVPIELYVGRVLASGAIGADRPMAALRAMAVVVATRVARLREALVAAVKRLPLFDESDLITAMNGTVRSPRTIADYVEGYRNRVLAAIEGRP